MRRTLSVIAIAVALFITGCKPKPADIIGLSSLFLDFGAAESEAALEVWNISTTTPLLPVTIVSSAEWLIPAVDVLYAPGPADAAAEYDKQELALTAERRLLTGGAASATLTFSSPDVVTRTAQVTIAPPYEAIGVSEISLDFGQQTTTLSLNIWNANPNAGNRAISIETSEPWLEIAQEVVSSNAPAALNGPFNTKNIVVNIDRDQLEGGPEAATITFSAAGYVSKTVAVSVFEPYDAIAVSNTDLQIGLSTIPQRIEVWNKEARLTTLDIQVTPQQPWIQVTPDHATSAAPAKALYDKQGVTVTINRAMLSAGEHQADIVFSATDCVSESMRVHVTQEEDGHLGALNIRDIEEVFAAPYLVEFHFSLEDEAGAPVSAEPAQFTLSAAENRLSGGSVEVSVAETGLHMRKEAARQQKADLVLDYTLSMQYTEGAIEAMQDAVKDVLLPTLNEDAQIGVVEFHREDYDPQRAAEFSVDRQYTAARIDAIQTEFVNGFASASRAWDAILFSLESYPEASAALETRYIILVSDGHDTSSLGSVEDIVTEAVARQVKIYVVAFGNNPNLNDLGYITAGTGGRLLSAQTQYALEDAAESIVDDFAAKYVLRWASLTRNDNLEFTPSFSVALDGDEAAHESDRVFTPSDWTGDSLEGRLRIEATSTDVNTSIFLRADYIPRNIAALRIFIETSHAFDASLTGAADDGLIAAWTLDTTEAPDLGGVWLDIESPGGALPFAAFGPMLRLDFGDAASEEPLLDGIYVDNTLYTNGQTFEVQGFENTPPE